MADVPFEHGMSAIELNPDRLGKFRAAVGC